MSKRREVADFLSAFKAALSLGHRKLRRRADEKKAHLSGLQITQNEADTYLMSLTPDNYSRGPEPDDFASEQNVWVFGCDINGTEAYLKLALEPDRRRRTVVHAVIWSFHPAEYPIRYPLRVEP
ncbi:MAG: hypothetical protein JW719_07130 [Pirellulales bacterium]|nr:hypothetical protein [Pirellulales bacterium]